MLALPVSLSGLLKNTTHRLVSLFKLTRTDGIQFFLTNHNKELRFDGELYTPMGGFSASAQEKQGGVKVQNFTVRGILDSTAITFEDLHDGRYLNAQIIESLVDWKYVFAGAFDTRVYSIAELTFTNGYWEAQVEGITRELRPKKGGLYSRPCDFILGDSDCRIDISLFTTFGATVGTPGTDKRTKFSSDLTEADGIFDGGTLTWLTGANTGLTADVKDYVNASGELRLQVHTQRDIQTGDTFDIAQGCLKEAIRDCKDKFDNLVNHGGFPFIPGSDSMYRRPSPI